MSSYYYIYPILFIFIAFYAFIMIVFAVQSINMSNIRKRQEEINNQVKESLRIASFKPNRVFYLSDYATSGKPCQCKKYIGVDSENKKICLIDYDKGKLLIVNFDEISDYEIYENESLQTFGGNGGAYGAGLFAAGTDKMCKELNLIIRLNKYDISQVNYDIIFNTSFNIGIYKSSKVYKECLKSVQEVVSFLEVLKRENNKNNK